MIDPATIERLAREAGCFTPGYSRNYWAVTEPALARFAALIEAHALERAAKAVDDAKVVIWGYHDKQVKDTAETVCINLAAAIRAL